jgi:hypothetical protein
MAQDTETKVGVMTTSEAGDTVCRCGQAGVHDIDIHELLAERKLIAQIWAIEDVQEVRPDLNDEQAWEVLEFIDSKKDAELGITWTTIECFAANLFPIASS